MNHQVGYQYKLETINRLSDTLYKLKAIPISSDHIMLFEAGQYCLLSHSGYKSRFFSFADQPVQSGVVTLYIRFTEKDRSYLEDLKKTGCIELHGPYGTNHYVWDRCSGRVLLLAEGVGIAPFRSMLKNINIKNQLVDIMWFVKSEDEVTCFADMVKDLRRLSSQNRWVNIVTKTNYDFKSLSCDEILLDQYEAVCLSGSFKLYESFVCHLKIANNHMDIYSDFLDFNGR